MKADEAALIVIERQRGFAFKRLGELWMYRELAWVMAVRDIKVRYKHTVLGVAWAIVRPVLTMLMFSAVFGRLARVPTDGTPYPLFVFAGLLPWMFFAQATSTAAQSIASAGPLITRVYFPRMIVPIATVAVALVDLLVGLVILFPLMLWFAVYPGVELLLAPVLVVAATGVALGSGLWLAALTVTYRDVKHIEPFLLQLWMLATPVIYPASLVPVQWRWIAYVNPMAGVVEGFRACWLGSEADWVRIAVSFLFGGGLLVTGVAYFGRTERRFADLI